LVESESDKEFVVLFVCTGNICRSPLAEQLFRLHTESRSGLISTLSAGTHARPGQAMTEQAAALSLRYAGDPSRHKASALTFSLVKRANLVVAMSREHRAEVVSLMPRASRKTFTLRELVRLINTYKELEPEAWSSRGLVSVPALDALVREVATLRGFSTVALLPTDDDIVDPYRRDQGVYDEVGSQSITFIADAIIDSTSLDHVSKSDGLSQRMGSERDQSRSGGQPRGNRD